MLAMMRVLGTHDTEQIGSAGLHHISRMSCHLSFYRPVVLRSCAMYKKWWIAK